jgi:hypothetical protein
METCFRIVTRVHECRRLVSTVDWQTEQGIQESACLEGKIAKSWK